MRIQEHIGGYNIWLSATDTYKWAHKAGANWPCSTLANKRLFAAIDNNGLVDLTVNGRDAQNIDGNELAACIGDCLPIGLRQFWPWLELKFSLDTSLIGWYPVRQGF